MQLRYVGPARQSYTLSLPVPFLALSDRIGEVQFQESQQWIADVPDEYVEYLLDDCCGGIFEPVEVDGAGGSAAPKADRLAEKVEKALTKRFTGKAGKWDAKGYIKKHKLEGLVELHKNAYGQWTLVHLGESEAPATPISSEGEGQEVESGDAAELSVG